MQCKVLIDCEQCHVAGDPVQISSSSIIGRFQLVTRGLVKVDLSTYLLPT